MADFALAYAKTMTAEGGYAHDPADRGGETYRGIARNHHPGWEGWPLVDAWKRRGGDESELGRNAALHALVATFYRRNYWDALRLSDLRDQAVADEIFDSAVNCGVSRAGRWLQQAVNLVGRANIAEDGAVGPITIAAANATEWQGGLLRTLNGLQFGHYHQIVQRDPSQQRFFRGWLRRVWEA